MRSQGNLTQWPETYPSKEILERDISAHRSYVIESDGEIVGTFVMAIGSEPTYEVIEEGAWIDDSPYATIHRIASNGKVSGIADAALDFIKKYIVTLGLCTVRIDTHADNRKMRDWINRSGFKYCGVIHLKDGAPRIAFQLNIQPS